MIETLNFAMAVPVLILTLLVIRAYLPASIPGRKSFSWLAMAIVLSFSSVAGAILMWDILTYVDFLDDFRAAIGRLFNLINRNLLGGLAAYLHLVALHRKLDSADQANWSPLEMAWYPNRRRCLRRLLGRENDE